MSDFKALAKHSTNYLFATMATKALAFISIPVYTRLLSVFESQCYFTGKVDNQNIEMFDYENASYFLYQML